MKTVNALAALGSGGGGPQGSFCFCCGLGVSELPAWGLEVLLLLSTSSRTGARVMLLTAGAGSVETVSSVEDSSSMSMESASASSKKTYPVAARTRATWTARRTERLAFCASVPRAGMLR